MQATYDIETNIRDKVYAVLRGDLNKSLGNMKKNQKIKALMDYRNKYFPGGDLDYAFHRYLKTFMKV
jgi:hypothetical protein